jgi:FkbH-like protein
LRKLVGVYAIDLEAIIASLGHPAALDHRKELLYRQPYSDAFHAACASAVVRVFKARASEPKKCLVLDCDNTLWGGVIGEDGVAGIELGEDFPGRAFLEFQRQVVALRNTGIFIALNSKNNPEDVWEMFDNHSGMVLKRTDISTARVNWKTKSENLKEIAKDLNIGLDALVFIDDSHFEIAEVRRNAPEVMAIQVPEDVADFPVLMKNVARLFDRLDITADDTARVDMMQQEMDRRQLAQSMTDADFLSSLGLEVFLYPPGATDLARVTQLVNKTNQFNVTTRRYALDDIASLVADAETDVYCATVKDKFGDYGLIGVGIVCHREGGISEFDSLLMSCRVLGRGVETAMIAHAADLAAKRGAKELRGLYKRTRKNSMVADLFSRHGFTSPSGEMPDLAEVSWSRSTDPLAVPNYLAVRQQRPA